MIVSKSIIILLDGIIRRTKGFRYEITIDCIWFSKQNIIKILSENV